MKIIAIAKQRTMDSIYWQQQPESIMTIELFKIDKKKPFGSETNVYFLLETYSWSVERSKYTPDWRTFVIKSSSIQDLTLHRQNRHCTYQVDSFFLSSLSYLDCNASTCSDSDSGKLSPAPSLQLPLLPPGLQQMHQVILLSLYLLN